MKKKKKLKKMFKAKTHSRDILKPERERRLFRFLLFEKQVIGCPKKLGSLKLQLFLSC